MSGMHIIRIVLLVISTTGYILFLTKKIQVEFAVGVTFAAISVSLFLAGILNRLPEAAILLFFGGFICLGLSIRAHVLLKNLITYGSALLVADCVGLFFILYGSRFANEDIFNHWGTVIQVLTRYNRFPNYQDVYMLHRTYPTGAACWIYYCLFISGIRSEFAQIFAQNCLFLGMAVSLFPMCNKLPTILLTAAVIIMMLCCNQELCSLQVDNILAVTALSAVSFGVCYRKTLSDKYWWIAVWCCFLPAVKNSGILFAFFILVLLIPWLRWKKAGLIATLTGAAAILWMEHTHHVFPDAEKEKHAISLWNYRTVLGQKSREDIARICQLFCNRELSLQNKFIWLFALAVLLIAVSAFLHTEDSRLARRLSVSSIGCYCIHQTGLLGIYLVSMPLKEALGLYHYARYQKTALVFSAGILLITVLLLLKETGTTGLRRRSMSVSAAVICCLFLKYGIGPKWNYLKGQDPNSLNDRYYFDQVVSGYRIQDKSRIMTFTDSGEDPHNYYNALCRYYFAPSDLAHATPENTPDWDSYDYIFVLTKSGEARRFVTESVHSDKVTIVMK